MNIYFKLPSESGKSCRPVNSLLGYWSFTSWRNTYFFMQDFRSSSILPSQKIFINLFPQKKKVTGYWWGITPKQRLLQRCMSSLGMHWLHSEFHQFSISLGFTSANSPTFNLFCFGIPIRYMLKYSAISFYTL